VSRLVVATSGSPARVARCCRLIYFVSAEIYGGDVEEGTIGTWATPSLGGAEAIYTIDEVSKEYSDLRDGAEVADLAADDDGAAESRACVKAVR